MSIWFEDRTPELAQIQRHSKDTMVDYLGIRFIAIDDESVSATMPVDHRTHQPYGILHGGASLVLAETLGSMAAAMCVHPERQYVVGQEINANHIRAVRDGEVTGTATPIHLGRSSHVWSIRIEDPRGRLTCISRLTIAVLERLPGEG